ncbi:glutaminyl-tRNA synthase (glutamine-hydrolysing), partial [Synchytrium endobioticum]
MDVDLLTFVDIIGAGPERKKERKKGGAAAAANPHCLPPHCQVYTASAPDRCCSGLRQALLFTLPIYTTMATAPATKGLVTRRKIPASSASSPWPATSPLVPPVRQLERPCRLSWNLPFPTTTVEQVLSASATEIVKRITVEGQWTAEMVMMAYTSRALEVHKTTNAISQHFIDKAIVRARDLDHEFRRTGVPKGPLHGVPFIVDEHVDVQGADSTMGFSQFVNNPAPESALIVQALERAGAIPFAKANVPASLAAFDTSSPLYGVTTHPLHRGLSPGGSSGGVAALVCAGGAPIGLGTDIAGSSRIPAHFCGIYCLKPSSGRFPLDGVREKFPGSDTVKMVVGPMARYLQDVALVAQVLVEDPPRCISDACSSLPVMWDDQPIEEERPVLRFGYYIDDAFVRATPPCARAVAETLLALEAQGHECVRFEPPAVPTAITLALALLVTDGLVSLAGRDHIHSPSRSWSLPKWVRAVAIRRLQAKNMPSAPESAHPDIQRLSHLQRAQAEYQARFHEACSEFDAILTPAHVHPATPLASSAEMPWAASYSLLYSFLDYSAGVLPVTHVDAFVDVLAEPLDRKYNILEKRAYQYYNPARSHAMPVGVQIVVGAFQEEKTLAIMTILQNALMNFRTNMASPPRRLAASSTETSVHAIGSDRRNEILPSDATPAHATDDDYEFERQVAEVGFSRPIDWSAISSPLAPARDHTSPASSTSPDPEPPRKSTESRRSPRFHASGRKSHDTIRSLSGSIKKGPWARPRSRPDKASLDTPLANGKPRHWESEIIKYRKRASSKDLTREDIELRQSMEAVEKTALKPARPRLSLDTQGGTMRNHPKDVPVIDSSTCPMSSPSESPLPATPAVVEHVVAKDQFIGTTDGPPRIPPLHIDTSVAT